MTFFVVVQEFANHNAGPLLRRVHEMTVHIPLRAWLWCSLLAQHCDMEKEQEECKNRLWW
jgi:hypothetical protein